MASVYKARCCLSAKTAVGRSGSYRRSAISLRCFASYHNERQNVDAIASKYSRRDLLVSSAAIAAVPSFPSAAKAEEHSLYQLSAPQYGEEIKLDQFSNQNVNYPGLRALYEKYNSQGFNLIAFPCNQFGGQAPGSSQEEREYAYKKFGFEFPVMDKIEVNGGNAHPVYKLLKQQQPKDLPNGMNVGLEKGRIAWNYTKFIVDRNGRAAARFGPSFDPLKFEPYVAKLLAGEGPPPTDCIRHPQRSDCKA